MIWRQSTPVRDQLAQMRRDTAGGVVAGRRRRPWRWRRRRGALRSTAPMLVLLALNFAAWLGIYLLVARLLR